MQNIDFKSAPVCIGSANEYDIDALYQIISNHFSSLGINKELFDGKKVVIKPNLIIKKPPEYAATTRPEVLEAVIRVLKNFDCASLTIAESAGGPYTVQALEATYNVCKIKPVAEKYGVMLNYDTSYTSVECPDGKIAKSFNMLTPISEADIIINLPN